MYKRQVITFTQTGVSTGGEEGGEATTTTINCGGGQGSNEESITITKGNYTLTVLPGTHDIKPRWDSDKIRFYGTSDMSNTLTISGNTDITKVIFTCVSGYAKLATGTVSVDDGASASVSATDTTVTITITGSTKNVTISGTTEQSRFSSIAIN